MLATSTSLPSGAGRAQPRSLLDDRRVLWTLAALAVAGFLWRQRPILDVLLRLSLPDNDDAMRLVGVRDLLSGQSWFDTVQHRYLPPAGAAMHWSRYLDAALAALILVLRPFAGQHAEGIVAALWPPALFGAYLTLLVVDGRRLWSERAGILAIVVAAQMTTASLYAFGRIDHHNLQALAIVAAAIGLVWPGGGRRRAAAAGLICAASLAIGLETLPFVAVLGIAATLAWIVDGREDRGRLGAFGLGLGAGALVLFAGETAPSLWLVPECDALSAPWLLLALGGGLGAAGLAVATPRLGSAIARLVAAASLGAALVGAFLVLFPACAAGPYAALPPDVRAGWLAFVIEAMPAARALGFDPAGTIAGVMPLVAAGAWALRAGWLNAAAARRPLLLFGAMLATGAVVACFQMRGIYIASAFVPLVAGHALDRALRGTDRAGPRPASLLAPLAMFGHLWAMPILAVEALAPASTAEVKSMRSTASCLGQEAVGRLAAFPPGLVLAPIELGADLLLFTRHAIVAAPYHRNVAGLRDGLVIASGSEPDALAAIRRVQPDYIVLCRDWVEAGPGNAWARRLLDGPSPAWLAPLDLHAGHLRGWRVSSPPLGPR